MLVQLVGAFSRIQVEEIIRVGIVKSNNFNYCWLVVETRYSCKRFVEYCAGSAPWLSIFKLVLGLELFGSQSLLSLFLIMDKLQNLRWSVWLGLRIPYSLLIILSLFLLVLFTRLLSKVVFESRHNQMELHHITSILKSNVVLVETVFDKLEGIFKLLGRYAVVNKHRSHFVLVAAVEHWKNVLYKFCFHLICANF